MSIDRALVERFYRRAHGERWCLLESHFAEALERSVGRAAGEQGLSAAPLERYLGALHLEDLALACACAAGNDIAWEHFVLEFRPVLYRAADALDPHGGARELADSLYADLFGLSERGGERQSLFRYFHGRSSLATWLRAVLAQRHVDKLRSDRRIEPLPDEEATTALPAPDRPIEPDRGRYLATMKRALARAVSALSVRDRLRLACYYAQELTLAQTGRVLAEHEATTSRQLARTRKVIRENLERQLQSQYGLGKEEITRCFESVSEDAGPLDLEQILGTDAGARNPRSIVPGERTRP